MQGSTRKRGKTWTAYWRVTNPKSGEARQRTKGGFRTQKEAQRHLASVMVTVGDGSYIEPSKKLLVRFMLDEWLPAIRGKLRPLSVRRYETVARSLQDRDIGGVPLRALAPSHLNALYADLEREGLSISTRRLTHAVIGRALHDAERWGHVTRNVAQRADPPAASRSRAQSWSVREVRAFLDAVSNDRLYALWRLAATTGMRRGELLGLTWRAIDFQSSRVTIDQQLVLDRAKLKLAPPKSHRSERTIVLDSDTVGALQNHRQAQMLERDLAGSAYQDNDLVFASELGKPINPQWLGRQFIRARKVARIPTGTLHILRHTSATIALTEGGVPLHIVAARLGDRPETLLGVYSHLLPRSDEQAAEAIADVLVDKSLTSRAGHPVATGD